MYSPELKTEFIFRGLVQSNRWGCIQCLLEHCETTQRDWLKVADVSAVLRTVSSQLNRLSEPSTVLHNPPRLGLFLPETLSQISPLNQLPWQQPTTKVRGCEFEPAYPRILNVSRWDWKGKKEEAILHMGKVTLRDNEIEGRREKTEERSWLCKWLCKSWAVFGRVSCQPLCLTHPVQPLVSPSKPSQANVHVRRLYCGSLGCLDCFESREIRSISDH